MLKIPKNSPFLIFFSKLSFLAEIRFSQYISTNNFFSILSEFWRWRFEKFALNPNFRRYIRTILRFNREEAEIREKRSHKGPLFGFSVLGDVFPKEKLHISFQKGLF